MSLPHGQVVATWPFFSSNEKRVSASFWRTPASRFFSAPEIGHDHADVPAQHLRLAARRQVELLAPEIDPHVLVADRHVGVAGEAQPDDVEERREALVVDRRVDVLEPDDVVDVGGGAVVDCWSMVSPPALLAAGGRCMARCPMSRRYCMPSKRMRPTIS